MKPRRYTDGTAMSASDRRLYVGLTWASAIILLLLAGTMAVACLTGGSLFVVGLVGFVIGGFFCAEGIAAVSDRVELPKRAEVKRLKK